MFRLRKAALANWRQTLGLCIVWCALGGSAGLCLLAPLSVRDKEPGNQPGAGIAAIMMSLACKGF